MSIAYPSLIAILTDGAFSPFEIAASSTPTSYVTSINWSLMLRRLGMTKRELFTEHDLISGSVGEYDVEDIEEAD